jgi:hypothetical protein
MLGDSDDRLFASRFRALVPEALKAICPDAVEPKAPIPVNKAVVVGL